MRVIGCCEGIVTTPLSLCDLEIGDFLLKLYFCSLLLDVLCDQCERWFLLDCANKGSATLLLSEYLFKCLNLRPLCKVDRSVY